MAGFIVTIAMLGAWLLFAGPVYQAYLELNDADLKAHEIREKFRDLSKDIEIPEVSKWFWLFPPLGFALNSMRQRKVKNETIMLLDTDTLNLMDNYMNKAHGWVIIGWGAVFIGIKETFEFIKHFELSYLVFGLLVFIGIFLSFLNVFLSTKRSEKIRDIYTSKHTT